MNDFEKLFNKSYIRRNMKNPPREETVYRAFHGNYDSFSKDQLEDILQIVKNGCEALTNEITHQINNK